MAHGHKFAKLNLPITKNLAIYPSKINSYMVLYVCTCTSVHGNGAEPLNILHSSSNLMTQYDAFCIDDEFIVLTLY